DVVLDIERLIVESAIPVVAALDGNAKGIAWLLSQFCDACVYSQASVYSSASIPQSPALAQTAAGIFTHRFGNDAGREILLSGADYRGVDLQQRVGTLIVEEHDHVLAAAVKVAESWARLPRATLASWKKYTATTIEEKRRRLPAAAWEQQKDDLPKKRPAAARAIPLRSKVITATAHPEG